MNTPAFLTLILVITCTTTFAQPGNPKEPDGNVVPIEGEWIIVLMGGLLGVTGVLKHRSKRSKDNLIRRGKGFVVKTVTNSV